MSAFFVWLFRLSDKLQHSIIAAGFMLVAGLIFWVLGFPHPATIGATIGVVYFYGREVRDVEIHHPDLYNNWRVMLPWKWHYKDSEGDFLWPLATNTALAVLVEIVL